MRTNDECIAAMHSRAAELKREKLSARVHALQAGVTAIGLALTVAVTLFISGISPDVQQYETVDNMNASILSGSSMAGLVVVGVIAFVLGVAVTIFCYSLKNWQDSKDTENDK